MPRNITAALLLFSFLVGCAAVGPDYQPPQPELPAAWSVGGANSASAVESLASWWTLFNDPLLDSLIKRAEAANLDLKIAEARILQARAQYRLATAAAAPTLDVSGAYANTRQSGNTGSDPKPNQDLFQTGFDAGWEIDLFGGNRRASEAAEARLAAAGEDRGAVLVSLKAEVARNYLELRGSQQRLAVAQESCLIQEKIVALSLGRWESGFGNRLELAQAETQLALNRARLPVLENSTGQAIYRLALLLALPPLALQGELQTVTAPPSLPAGLPTSLPSDLLRRRPDIRRAERQLAASTAEIGVAVADLFPRFSLTGLLGLQSVGLGDLLSAGSRYWTVGPSIRWSLFDGGRVRARIAFSQAQQQEAQSGYEKTVLSSLNEVESSLLALTREQERHRPLSEAVASGQRALVLAKGRYQAGLTGLLDVLQAETAFYQAQDQLVQSEEQLALNLVALFKALGGGWNTDPSKEATNQIQTES